MNFLTGEKPGKGTYVCHKCGQTVTLYNHNDTLPPCPDCHGNQFFSYTSGNFYPYGEDRMIMPE